MRSYTFLTMASSLRWFCALSFAVVLAGCSGSSETVDELPYYVTPPGALDPVPDPALIEELLANSTTILDRPQEKLPRTAGFEDSIANLMSIALEMVTAPAVSHIPYVWGGKHIDRPTRWSTPPDTNGTCTDRIGLDCSGFVQHVFEAAGFGREAPELNAHSLAQVNNWSILTDRGYFVNLIPNPAIEDLMPGDVLFFSSGEGIYHTGFFWTASTRINGVTGPAMINSLGRSNCHINYANEAAGNPTGVMASLLTPNWQGKLIAALRIVGSSYIMFNVNGEQFHADNGDVVGGYAVYDSVKSILRIVGYEPQTPTVDPTGISFNVSNVTGPGTYPIPEVDYYAPYVPLLHLPGNVGLSDSTMYFGSAPRDTWGGPQPPQTGGTLKILQWDRSKYVGSMTATFTLRLNAYFDRLEDSTYTIDTVTYTTQVLKYYYKSVEVTGTVGGIMGYGDL
ncbi:MAG TPA: NlpC/P60 family protein [Candidatus Kapabacteria bacterium]|nr:NlpC/P60 family protein [Candidatus Kapabacteria bacterium]